MGPQSFWVAIATVLLTSNRHGGEYIISLPAGWNAVSFPSNPGVQQATELPADVTAIVAYRGSQTLSWKRGPDAVRDAALPELKAPLPQFAEQGELDLSSLKAHEGYMVYAEIPARWKVSFTALPPLIELEVDKWTFCGTPVGEFGSVIPVNEFSPPSFAPAVTMFGDTLDMFYLATAASPAVNAQRAWSAADLKGVVDPGNPTRNAPWNVRQFEAVWIKSRTALGSASKIEVRSSSPLSITPSVVLDLDDSSGHVDLQVRLLQGRSCVFGLRETDWYYSQTKPSDMTAVVLAAHDSVFTHVGFNPITIVEEQPYIVFSSAVAVTPYLETSHGPLNSKRALRVSCDRMTKGASLNVQGVSQRINRILKPGFYLGRMELMSTGLTQGGGVPTIVVLLEVPELYGPYEGFIHAQVLSVREDSRLNPLEFFRYRTSIAAGPIPFEALMVAAQPNVESIEIGRFPLRCTLSRVQGSPDKMQAVLEKRGSFIVNADTKLSGAYEFRRDVDAFHGIDVTLAQAKKTVFLESGLHNGKFKANDAPVLARPVAKVSGNSIVLAGNDGIVAETPQGTVSEPPVVSVSRDIKILLQEQFSGVLQGLMIERLGRSPNEGADGTVLGVAVTDSLTSKVRSASVPVYVIGRVELRRVPLKREDK
ncbi:hypothetical protein [Schlesneria sp.]|uniref:hypothetical protein n=1 Tax=Schlesneria sp. TaxID=2762018 RepID=UPI002EFB85C1